jgi:hypothetical protein
MGKQQRFAISVCALVLGGVSAVAFAGEVKGPPGTVDNTNTTAAPEHSNSACSYSGLNDLDPLEGQNESIVQTVADAWKYYGLPHGFPGIAGACWGGTNENREEP